MLSCSALFILSALNADLAAWLTWMSRNLACWQKMRRHLLNSASGATFEATFKGGGAGTPILFFYSSLPHSIPPPPLIPTASLFRLLVHQITRPFCAVDRKLLLGAKHQQRLPQCFRALASDKRQPRSGLGQLRRWLLHSKLTIETQASGGAMRRAKLASAALGVHFERSQRLDMVGARSRDPPPTPSEIYPK
eukprot:356661-Chlamydomonas_euryale.AAC.5